MVKSVIGKKLQIFVSSTYEDLVEQRLAAIEAILAAGHIPAAMEQFSPGDETAWQRIRGWIDGSDAFILILGGRYGSIESASAKSYVELEYDYACERQKPFFSLIIDERYHEARVKAHGLRVDEREHRDDYIAFRRKVMQRLCRLWEKDDDIRMAIFQKLPEWAQREDLVGWARADNIQDPRVAAELARLSRENRELLTRLESIEGPPRNDLEEYIAANVDMSPIPTRQVHGANAAVIDHSYVDGEEIFLVWDTRTNRLRKYVRDGQRWDKPYGLDEEERRTVRRRLSIPDSPTE